MTETAKRIINEVGFLLLLLALLLFAASCRSGGGGGGGGGQPPGCRGQIDLPQWPVCMRWLAPVCDEGIPCPSDARLAQLIDEGLNDAMPKINKWHPGIKPRVDSGGIHIEWMLGGKKPKCSAVGVRSINHDIWLKIRFPRSMPPSLELVERWVRACSREEIGGKHVGYWAHGWRQQEGRDCPLHPAGGKVEGPG